MSGFEAQGQKSTDIPAWMLPAAIAVLTLALFSDSLIIPNRVPADGGDLRSQYLYWRQFAFTELRHGHLPLWNPNSFFGTPFFGDPQSAMLYPPNWINFFLSPERAASWLIAIHFFLAGYFVGIWCRLRGCRVLASILAGTIYTCSGPIITNIAAGHLPLLCSAAWAPLLLCCVEQVFFAEGRMARRYILIGIGAVAMLALDGYPQFAYYTALASAIYALVLMARSTRRWRGLASVAIIFIGGWTIATAQIVASLQFARESVRASGLTLADASSFSLPPENLLTLLVPGIFGDAQDLPYFGRWFWWETCLCIGPAAIALMLFGASRKPRDIAVIALSMLMFLLAFGSYSPLFPVLFRYLPAFHDFRASARFGLLAILFLIPLAASGWDRLTLKASRPSRPRLIALTMLGVALGATSILAWRGGFNWLVPAMKATGQSFELIGKPLPAFITKAGLFAAGQLGASALLTLITAGLITTVSRRKTSIAILAAVILGEATWFAFSQRTHSDGYPAPRQSWAAAFQSLSTDQRVFVTPAWFAEAGPYAHFQNIGGYNPLILNRTAGYLAAVEEMPRGEVGQSDPEHIRSRLLRMVRGAWVMPRQPGVPARPLPNPLPQFALLSNFRVVTNPNSALTAVTRRGFDPASQIILESQPQPSPSQLPPGAAGSLSLKHQTTDSIELEITLSAPQILLITDAYSDGWHARPLDAGDKQTYQVLPADYCLRAIPLESGHHHILLEYRPSGVALGLWTSLFASLGYLALWFMHLRC
jgi:hypothetical protein